MILDLQGVWRRDEYIYVCISDWKHMPGTPQMAERRVSVYHPKSSREVQWPGKNLKSDFRRW